eukprot:sb/3468104/
MGIAARNLPLTFQNTLTKLSQCVPQLEELYARWDSLMGAMSQLTLRLCNNSPHDAYNHTLLLADFITTGRLNQMIYRHGVLAYMKCVQQDTQKRSAEASQREESMKMGMNREEIFDFDSEDTLIDDIRLSRRSLEEFSQIPPQDWSRERQLEVCRTKLGLLFPPLDLGTNRILNITVGSENKGCWNGTAVGAYVVDYFSPRHESNLATNTLSLSEAGGNNDRGVGSEDVSREKETVVFRHVCRPYNCVLDVVDNFFRVGNAFCEYQCERESL